MNYPFEASVRDMYGRDGASDLFGQSAPSDRPKKYFSKRRSSLPLTFRFSNTTTSTTPRPSLRGKLLLTFGTRDPSANGRRSITFHNTWICRRGKKSFLEKRKK